ncbi:MAG: diguanylate cyclase [Bryobacteraceae bacterium]
MKILIADDSIVSRRVLEASLLRWEYEVESACDGREAWERLQREDGPDLAILDWMMPELTGPEVCRLVRQQTRERYTYLFLLTSKSDRRDLIAGLEAGADDYLVKPFDQHELEVRLRAARRILDLQRELLRTRAALEEQATKDSLTGIWNRPTILSILHRELARSEREQRPFGLVMVDLDHFKSINDTHGHAAGDIVLKEAARRMREAMRSYDSLGRYGGEEFLIILPGCDAECTRAQAERMRRALCDTAIELPAASLHITASFGATAYRSAESDDPEALLHASDQALYAAKASGRDRVILIELDTVLQVESQGSPRCATAK